MSSYLSPQFNCMIFHIFILIRTRINPSCCCVSKFSTHVWLSVIFTRNITPMLNLLFSCFNFIWNQFSWPTAARCKVKKFARHKNKIYYILKFKRNFFIFFFSHVAVFLMQALQRIYRIFVADLYVA